MPFLPLLDRKGFPTTPDREPKYVAKRPTPPSRVSPNQNHYQQYSSAPHFLSAPPEVSSPKPNLAQNLTPKRKAAHLPCPTVPFETSRVEASSTVKELQKKYSPCSFAVSFFFFFDWACMNQRKGQSMSSSS